MERIQEIFESIPKPVIFAIVILALIGIFFLWKKWSSKDKENEVLKGVANAEVYAKNIQESLDSESEPMMSSVTPSYAKEVQQGLGDLETSKKIDGIDEDEDFDAFEE